MKSNTRSNSGMYLTYSPMLEPTSREHIGSEVVELRTKYLHTPIRLMAISADLITTFLSLLLLFVPGTLIRSLGARENLLGILDILLLNILLDRLEGLGREPIQGYFVHPRLDVALPLLLERDIGTHALRVLRHARLALTDVVLEGGDAAEDLDQGLNPLIDHSSLVLLFRRLLPAAGAEDHLRLVPGLRVLERQDAPAEVLTLVVAAAEEALDQVEVLDDLRVAAVLALLDVEEGLFVRVEAPLVQIFELRLDGLLDPVEVAQRTLPLGDLEVPELLFGVLVAPVAVGRRGAEPGGALDLLLVDRLGVLFGLLGLGVSALESGGIGPGSGSGLLLTLWLLLRSWLALLGSLTCVLFLHGPLPLRRGLRQLLNLLLLTTLPVIYRSLPLG
ncbi:hypothetical protein PG993_011401 [Apiospora rasikravindrae]|uniref:RDD domain-containing protein n=1 Tax=Apiospora rasikravindrae TaxID=990691 RepID=A0ABR1SE47_9PEZI